MKDVLLLLVYLLSILARMLRPGGLPTGTASPLVFATTKTVLVLVVHLLATVAKCLGPGDPRAPPRLAPPSSFRPRPFQNHS